MTHDDEARSLVIDLYRSLLKREPEEKELHDGALALTTANPFQKYSVNL